MGKNYGDPGLPNHQNTRPGFTNENQRNTSNTFGISSAAGYVKGDYIDNSRNSIPVVLLWFAPFYHSQIKAIENDMSF